MVKDFITNSHVKENKTDKELQSIKRELVHRHVAWLTALRYQLRKEKPWEMHLKSNKEFRASQYKVCEDEEPIEEIIIPFTFYFFA